MDGLSSVKEVVGRAKELKASAAVLTDHGSISGLPELMKEAKEAGVKPVVGCEFYVVEAFQEQMKDVPRLHLCVWAKSWGGVCSIMRQLSLANRQFYRRPLIDMAQAQQFTDCMVGTACCFGVLSTDNYAENCRALHAAYGDDLYIEIMPHSVNMGGEHDLQRVANVRGVAMAGELGVKLLATNDSHYTLEEDAEAHRVMMATQYNKRLAEYEAWPPVFFMRDMAQVFTAFTGLGYLEHNDIAQAMMNTISIAEKVDIQMPVFGVNLPKIYEDESRALMDSCLEGWKQKLHGTLGKQYDVYRKRLVYELEVIKKLKFVPYFLMVQDIIKWARGQGVVVGPARGSSAGSLVCYLMDITRVDPIKHGLYFERFLNPERNDLPDIDVDFQDDRRGEVIDYIVERYGRDKVCQISTYQEMAIKGAFRDVARAYGVDLFKVNAVSKQLEEEEDFSKIPELEAFSRSNPDVVKFAKRLNGVIRGASKHACGVVISSEPIEAVAAVEKRRDSMVTCWDKNQCEAFGLVKMDVLGLVTLSVLDQAVKDVERHHGAKVVLEKIPLDDPATLKAFAAGDGDCIFQFESHGMQELLKSLKVEGFENMVACTALYRPGPLGAGLTDRYAKVSRGLEYPRYTIPELEPILSDTNSVLVYQEQIMRVFNELGGFTWSEADKMRKIIGKKLGADAFEEHREHFVKGCGRNGIAEEAASELFSDMVSFAAYSFNKCVSGDTVLMRCATGKHETKYTVEEMYKIVNDPSFPAFQAKKPIRDKWKRQGGYGYGMSMFSDGRIRKNKIVDIQPSGRREVFRVTLIDGKYIDVTDNHSFPTANGKMKLSELEVGDLLYICGKYEPSDFARVGSFSDVKGLNAAGKKYGPKCGFPTGEENPAYTNGSYSSFVEFKKDCNGVCTHCGASVVRTEVHHKNGDRSDSSFENLEELCVSCHKKADYKLGRTKRGEKGYPSLLIEIESIESIGERETYDVTMEAPNHNFLTDSGIVTCNSHAVAYTMVSWYTMWFKVHYPAIFLAAYMSCVKSDEAVTKGIREARRLGVPVQMPDINLSTDRYAYDPEAGIVAPLSAVKGVGGKAVENILKVREDRVFLSLDDFQNRVTKRVVNIRVTENLVNAGAFVNIGAFEPDKEKRERLEAELMPAFDLLPRLSVIRDAPINTEALEMIQKGVENYYGEGRGLFPVVGRSTVVMVVNNQMKGEKRLAGKPSTNYIFTRLSEDAGIDRRFITYTSHVKANLGDPRKAGTKDRQVGETWLRAEIEAIQPKLIYCCTADAWPVFAPGEKISQAYGRVRYNKAFQAFVMAGPSPQHAAWRPEEVGAQFTDCIDKIGKIFRGD